MLLTQTTPSVVRPRTYDAIGIGFGPSNLALAAALRETAPTAAGFNFRFLERSPTFVWHGNMLLDNSRMQISFLKDLVTLRNPASRFSFINYLHQKQRLQDFINLNTFYPSRHEFNDYLSWVADQFADHCDYGEEVLSVEPELSGRKVQCLRVRSRSNSGQESERLAQNVVISVGGSPRIPDEFQPWSAHPRVFHSSNYLDAIGQLKHPKRVAIIGSGQSAAEIFLDLHDRDPNISVDMISRAPAMRPADSSPFVNQIFNTDYTDYVYRQPSEDRQNLLYEFGNTNYAVADLDLIESIFDVLYQQKVTSTQRHNVFYRRRIGRVDVDQDAVALEILSLDDSPQMTCRYDAVVLATGYNRQHHKELLKPLQKYFVNDEVGRDYRVETTPDCQAGIFLQGCCEATHGLSDTLLSVLPIRAKEIVSAMSQTVTAG
jgi:L-ornithine N5-oxygenase